jgi:putative salt-induced outer membrane protein YdiY
MMTAKSSACVRFALCAFLAVSSSAEARSREKTDIVTLDNGDRVTCEILGLEYGQLQVKTSAMGTLNIKWEEVASVQSKFVFDVEVLGAVHHYGTIAAPEDDKKSLVVKSDGGDVELYVAQVTRISEIDSTFWKRIHGSMSIGYDFTKSTDVSTASAGLNATYRAETFAMSLDISLQQTKAPDEGTLDRDQASFAYQWLRPNRNFWLGLASLERNEELGIDARLTLGGGLGRYLRQTSFSEFAAYAGAGVTQEWVTGDENSQQSIEGILGATWHVFRLVGNETSLSTSATLFPGITESGRYRGKFDITLRKDLISDLTLDISAYYDYDNKPPDQGKTETSDYGVNTSLSYSF